MLACRYALGGRFSLLAEQCLNSQPKEFCLLGSLQNQINDTALGRALAPLGIAPTKNEIANLANW